MMRLFFTYALGLWWPIIALASKPVTAFIGTTVEHVDTAGHTMTIKTQEGQSWTLKVADPELLTKHHVQRNDQVSIEVDTSHQVTTIAKAGEPASRMDHGLGR